jgi:hypothetical protein
LAIRKNYQKLSNFLTNIYPTHISTRVIIIIRINFLVGALLILLSYLYEHLPNVILLTCYFRFSLHKIFIPVTTYSRRNYKKINATDIVGWWLSPILITQKIKMLKHRTIIVSTKMFNFKNLADLWMLKKNYFWRQTLLVHYLYW